MQVGSRQSSVDGLSRQSESPVDSRQSRVPAGHARSGYLLKENTRVSTATSLMRKVLDIAAVPGPHLCACFATDEVHLDFAESAAHPIGPGILEREAGRLGEDIDPAWCRSDT
jgi:hypothetical protein